MKSLKKSISERHVKKNGLFVYCNPPNIIGVIPAADLRKWIRDGIEDKLERAVLRGQGRRLLSEAETLPLSRYLHNLIAKCEALHTAVEIGSLLNLQELLVSEYNRHKLSTCCDEAGVGLLHKAVYYNFTDIAEWLVKCFPELVHQRDSEGRTALHYTAACRDEATMAGLLERAGAVRGARDAAGRTLAAYRAARTLLALPAADMPSRPNPPGLVIKRHNIRIWCHECDMGRLQRVVWAGQGSRLLSEVSSQPIVKRFLEAVPYMMNTIRDMHNAVIQNDLEGIIKLSSDPVPPQILSSKDSNNMTVFHKAAGLGRCGILKYIAERYPQGINETDNDGRTPLHYAAIHKDDQHTFKTLIGFGADEGAIDKKNKTPAYYFNRQQEIDKNNLKLLPDAPRTPSSAYPPSWDWKILDADYTSDLNKKPRRKNFKTSDENISSKTLSNTVSESTDKNINVMKNSSTHELISSLPELNDTNEIEQVVEENPKNENENTNSNEKTESLEEEKSNNLHDNGAENNDATEDNHLKSVDDVEEREFESHDRPALHIIEEHKILDDQNNDKFENEALAKFEADKTDNNSTDNQTPLNIEDIVEKVEEATSDDFEVKCTTEDYENTQIKDSDENLSYRNSSEDIPQESNIATKNEENDKNFESPLIPLEPNKQEEKPGHNLEGENIENTEIADSTKTDNKYFPYINNDSNYKDAIERSKENEDNDKLNGVKMNDSQEEEASFADNEGYINGRNTQESLIEGIVSSEAEKDSQDASVTFKGNGDLLIVDNQIDPEVTELINTANMEMLATLVLNGEGSRLIGRYSNNLEIQAFLENVPVYMQKINKVHVSAKEGTIRELQAALDRRKFAIARDPMSANGATPLHVATVYGKTNIIKYLGGRFPETLSAVDFEGRTALHYAAVLPDNGHYYNLLQQLGANSKDLDDNGQSADDYYKNPNLLPFNKLLTDFGMSEEEIKDMFSDKVPEDRVSCRRTLDNPEVLDTLDRCYRLLISARQTRTPLSASSNKAVPLLVLGRFLKKPIFDVIKYRITKLDHNLFDVIWPAVKKIPDNRNVIQTVDEDFPAGVTAPDYYIYDVFSEFLTPLLKDIHNINISYELPFHSTSDLVRSSNLKPSTSSDPLVELNVDPSDEFVLSGNIECSRNLDGFELPLNLNIGKLETIERIITTILLNAEFTEVVEQLSPESDQKRGNYYTLNEVLEKPSEVCANLASSGLLISLCERDEIDDFSHLHGRHWPYGRGVFISDDKTTAIWINVHDHLRVIVSTPADSPGEIGLPFSKLSNIMRFLHDKLDFVWHEKLGHLSSRPTFLGAGLRFHLIINFPGLSQDLENIKQLCAMRGLQYRESLSSDIARVSNYQCLGATEIHCFNDYATAISNLLHLEKDLSLHNSAHIATMLSNIFRRKRSSLVELDVRDLDDKH